MAGYTRQSLAQILNGEIVSAPPLNAEFNQILAAFNNSTGHKHDGTAAEGPPIDRIADLDQNNLIFVDTSANQINFYVESSAAAVGQISVQDGAIVPFTDNDIDLGSSSFEFKDLYIDGTANIDTLAASLIVVEAGTASAASITTTGDTDNGLYFNAANQMSYTSGGVAQVTFKDGSIVPVTDNDIDLGAVGAEFKDLYIDGTANIDSLVADTVDINAGTIDNTVIGATTPAAGTFTNLTVSTGSTIDFTGATVSNGGTFTTVTISGGSITGITDLAIADGGTGASTASAARTNLGLAIGTNVQAYDAGLQSISGLTTTADQMIYTTSSDTYATAGLTSAGRALLDDADASAQRTTLGLGTIATQNANNVAITGGTISGISNLSDIGNALPYTFSTTTTDSDPGSGVLRLNNATQNTATEIYIDDEEANAADVSAFIQLLSGGNNPSSVLGTITLRKEFNPESFLQFKVTGVTNASGYTKLTIINTSSSTANPFSNSDNVFLDINLSGDKGDTGDVTGPASSTDNAIVRWDGTGGNLVQDSSVVIDDSGNVGIGTSSPSTLLDVDGTITAAQYDSTESLPDIKPSLNLDFANVKKLDPRITYTRASTGTYYDGKTFAKAEENLLLQSQDYSTTWTVTNLTPVTGKTAPDGTSTATEFTASAGNAVLTQGYTALADDYTFSVWLRRVTGTGNIDIAADNGTWNTETITGTWTRYEVTQTPAAGSKTAGIRIVTSGDAIEVWGAQLEQRSSLTDYTPTTTQPITNYIPALQTAASGVARFDHDPITSESLGFLIEEQRTNLLTYSEDFSNAAWTKNNLSITSNIVVAPDGTLTGDKIVYANTSSGAWPAQFFSFSASTTYTFTAYYKAAEETSVRHNFFTSETGDVYLIVDLTDGSFTTGGASDSYSVVDVGNGWYRVSITETTDSTVTNGQVQVGRRVAASGDGYSGVYVWGAQLEQASFPTSYIKTTTAQATRNADAASMTGTNFSEWYRQNEGALYARLKANVQTGSGFARFLSFSDGSSDNEITILSGSLTDSDAFMSIRAGASAVASNSADAIDVAGQFGTFALAYATNDFAFSVNGAATTTDTTGVVPSGINRLDIYSAIQGEQNFSISRLTYYPKRLSNATLQALTEE